MLNAAIYGVGKWGQTLVRSVQGKSDKIRFSTGVARSLDKYRDFARQTDLTLSDDYDAVLRNPDIDAVVIATANSLHPAHACQAARAGKHVLVEKPFGCVNVTPSRQCKPASRPGSSWRRAFNRRFLPAMRDLKQLVEAGSLGQIVHVEGQCSGPTGLRLPPGFWRGTRAEAPGGGMTARGIHMVDAMISFCGAIRTVHALSERRVVSAEIDDTTAMLFTFERGMSGYLGTIMVTADFWRLHVFGTEGWAEMHGERCLITSDLDGNVETRDYEHVDIERAELEAFADAIAGTITFPVPPGEAAHGTAVLEALVESADNGITVTVT